MPKEYVARRDGGYYVAESRVSLDSVIYAFLLGESPEEIVESFPALTLEEVYGAITFYLADRDAIDAYLRAGKHEFDRLRAESRKQHPLLYAKLEAARTATRL